MELSIAENMETGELSEADIKVNFYRGRDKLNILSKQLLNKEIDL